METIKVNGRTYKAKELDFNFLCDLQDAGINIEELETKIMSATRVYVAYCMGAPLELAGNEINSHIISGGDMTEIVEVFVKKAEDSDFFRALSKETDEKESPKRTSKKKDTEVTE